MNHLPKPDSPHPDWSRFLQALWDHGRDNPDAELVQRHLNNARLAEALSRTTERRDGPAFVRPSNLLSCARQAHLLLKGHDPEPLSVGLAPSFGIGHLIEAYTRAYLLSALPPGFALSFDTRVPLPSWWPKDHPRFADEGTNDFTIRVTDKWTASAYLDLPRVTMACVFDLKTAGMQPFNQHKRVRSLADKPDGFGYISQVTLYAAGHEAHQGEHVDAVLMVFNRNSPMQGVACRALDRGLRMMEEDRLRALIACARDGGDPGLEFMDRWGGEGAFYCNKYCSMREHCAATPVVRAEA